MHSAKRNSLSTVAMLSPTMNAHDQPCITFCFNAAVYWMCAQFIVSTVPGPLCRKNNSVF